MRCWCFVFITLSLASCASEAKRGPEEPLSYTMVLSDVLPPHDAIVGRVQEAGVVRLLTKHHRLVSLDVRAPEAVSVALIGVNDEESLTGFGQLADGSLVALSGWSTLLRLTKEGTVASRQELPAREAGLQSAFGRLLYQPFDFDGGGPVLVTREGVEGRFAPWGSLRVVLGTDPGPLRLAQSVASCGVEVDDRVPCWLASRNDVELIDNEGRGSVVRVDALREWLPQDGTAFGRNPHRVIRDVWLRSQTSMWMLVRASHADIPDRRGERGLWQVAADGQVTARHLLPFRARLIVGAERNYVFVLTADGHVARVEV